MSGNKRKTMLELEYYSPALVRCFHCKDKGYVTGFELSQQYGTTSHVMRACKMCSSKNRSVS